MTSNAAYTIGKAAGKHPKVVGATLVGAAVFAIVLAVTSEPEAPSKKPATPKTAAEICTETIDKAKLIYQEQASKGANQQAANAIRHCATELKDPALQTLVDNADFAHHAARAADTALSNTERRNAAAAALVRRPDDKQVAAIKAKLDTAVQAEAKAQQKALVKAKKSQGVTIGMSKQDVLDSAWGRPESVNTTHTARGTREQWVYGLGQYLYFQNDTLVGIQTRD